jgi:hypothetical protein
VTVLNLQVAASGDDAWQRTTTLATTDTRMYSGHLSGSIECFAHFEDVSGLSGATINSAVPSCMADGSSLAGTPLTKIRAEDAEAPASPTTAADFDGRTLTTAGVDYDPTSVNANVFNDLPDITAVIQELADSHDPSTINLFLKDDGTDTGASNYIKFRTYDQADTDAAKLDIDYTAGAGGGGLSIPIAMHHYKQMAGVN